MADTALAQPGVDLVWLGRQTFERMAEMMRGVSPAEVSRQRRGTKGTPWRDRA